MKILGIRLEVSAIFILTLVFMAIFQDSLYALFASIFVFLHELTHMAVAKKLGYTPEKISLGIFGGVLQLKESFLKPRHELLIHLSGPAFSLIMAGLFYMITENVYSPVCEELLMTNMSIGIFNLLPFYPLDGGKVIRLYMSFFLGYGRAIKISRFFSVIFCILLFLTGIFLVQYNKFHLIFCALAINLLIITKNENTFFLFKTVRIVEESDAKKSGERMVVCRQNERAYRCMQRYKPFENRIFAIVNNRGNYRGQLTELELLEGIYDCGIYASFEKILLSKDIKRTNRFNKKENPGTKEKIQINKKENS